MDILIKAVQLLLSLGLLVLLHEFGHFITARMFKTRVDKFYLFFDFLFPLPGVLNFSLFKKKVGDTEYGLGWFPMGGYVQIAGMIDENLNTDQMNEPAQPWEFRSKPAWQRLIIMLGGIIMNVLVAFLIYAMVLFAWGEKLTLMSSLKDGVAMDSTALKLGFKNGDRIISVDGKEIIYFNDLRKSILVGHMVQLDRNGENVEINLPKDLIDQVASTKNFYLMGPRQPLYISGIRDSSENKNAGLMKNDHIVAINDSIKIKYYDEFATTLQHFKNQKINLTVERKGELKKFIVSVNSTAEIRITLSGLSEDQMEKQGYVKFERRKFNFMESFPAGVNKTFSVLGDYIDQFKLILSPSTGAYKHMGGFISMGNIFPAEWDWEYFWSRTAFISVILAFMNLLPIPALDGGHVVFTLWEMITRRKPSIKVLTYSQYVGMSFLLLLMIYANLNDVIRLFK